MKGMNSMELTDGLKGSIRQLLEYAYRPFMIKCFLYKIKKDVQETEEDIPECPRTGRSNGAC